MELEIKAMEGKREVAAGSPTMVLAEHSVAWRGIIAKRANGGMVPLRLSLGPGSVVLPIFSSRKAAQRFLEFGIFEPGWSLRESSDGEIISLLHGLCGDVGWVFFDPPPKAFEIEGTAVNLISRESLMRSWIRGLRVPASLGYPPHAPGEEQSDRELSSGGRSDSYPKALPFSHLEISVAGT